MSTRRRFRALLWLSLTGLVLLGACSSQTASTSNLGLSKPSEIEALPVPQQATRKALENADPGTISYELPTGVSLADLRAWYDAKLPVGTDWQGWKWCESTTAGDNFQRTWSHPGTGDILTLVVGTNKNPTRAFVFISGGQDQPCTK